jgi:asparagine synthase (glutamine-hydrolysing)
MLTSELFPFRLETDALDSWLAAIPKSADARGLPPAPARSEGVYASDGVRAVVFDGVLYERGQLVEGGRNGDGTDARLVLDAYCRFGESVVSRLNGLFSLVVWDPEEELLLCARDPMGIHPLFYAEVGEELRLSPSFEALRRSPGVSGELDRVVVAEQACLRWHDPEETLVRGIRRVPPGHAMTIRKGRRTVRRYWDPSPTGRDDWITEDELPRFEELFAQAIDRCLVHGSAGIYLSGGLDSVSVAAVARDRSREAGLEPPWALSLRFPHPDCNEEELQRSVAQGLGLPQLMVDLNEAAGPEGIVGAALALSRRWPTPLLNYWLPAYQHLGIEGGRRGCRAILTGTGGDEWLCVSPYYGADLLRQGDLRGIYHLWANLSRSNPIPKLLLLRNMVWRYGARDLLAAEVATGLDQVAPGLLRRHRERKIAAITPEWVARDPEIRRQMDERALRYRRPPTSGSLYQRELQEALDHPLMNIEVEEIYESGRRLGVRVLQPFWDADLVRFLVRVPPELLNRGGRSKGVVREMLARRFPELGFDRHKKVVATNYSSELMLREGRRAWEELGGPVELAKLDAVDFSALQSSAMRIFGVRDANEVHRLWYVLSLEAWLRGQVTG